MKKRLSQVTDRKSGAGRRGDVREKVPMKRRRKAPVTFSYAKLQKEATSDFAGSWRATHAGCRTYPFEEDSGNFLLSGAPTLRKQHKCIWERVSKETSRRHALGLVDFEWPCRSSCGTANSICTGDMLTSAKSVTSESFELLRRPLARAAELFNM